MTEIIACDVLIYTKKNEEHWKENEKKIRNHGYSHEREDWQ